MDVARLKRNSLLQGGQVERICDACALRSGSFARNDNELSGKPLLLLLSIYTCASCWTTAVNDWKLHFLQVGYTSIVSADGLVIFYKAILDNTPDAIFTSSLFRIIIIVIIKCNVMIKYKM